MQVDGYSLDAQKDKLRKYAEYQDMTIVSEFSDAGFSGKSIKGRVEGKQPSKLNNTAVFGQLSKFGIEQDKRFAVTYPRANQGKKCES